MFSIERERAVQVQENRLLAEGGTRGQDTRRMRGGRGNARSRSDTVPSFSFAPFAQPFSTPLLSRFLHCILVFVARVHRAFSRSRAQLVPISVSVRWRLGEDPRSRPSAHDPRPCGHGVIRPGVLNIWVIVNANRERTPRQRVPIPDFLRPLRVLIAPLPEISLTASPRITRGNWGIN